MRRFFTYTIVETKRIFRLYPAVLTMALLLSLVLGALLYTASVSANNLSTGSEDERLSVGIVGLDSSPYLSLGISLLKTMDSSRTEVEFTELSEEEALSKLQAGELAAAVLIPEGTIEKLLSGRTDLKMKLLLPMRSAGAGTILVREAARAISDLIASMEANSYTLADFYTEMGVPNPYDISDAQTDLLVHSINKILKRGDLFTMEKIKTQGSLTIESYYLTAMFLLLVLLSGVLCAAYAIRTDYALPSLLKIRGLGEMGQILAEYISLLSLLLSIGLVLLPLTGWGLSQMPIRFSELGGHSPDFLRNYCLFGLKSIPVVLLAGAIDLFLYEIADSTISGVLLQFLVTIALSYVSGIFYPVNTFPAAVRKIAPFFPTRHALLYLGGLLNPGPDFLPAVRITFAFTAVFLILTALMRRKNLEGRH